MNEKFNTLIIGAGNISSKYDDPKSNQILSHAHAVISHPNFELLGFVDIDINSAIDASKKWGGKAYNTFENACEECIPDVVINATPPEAHLEVLTTILEKSIKFVITEKPLTTNFEDANQVVRLFMEKKVPVSVNYSRRYVPEFIYISKKTRKGYYGKFLNGSAYYGKGILHNGSHMINLIQLLIGNNFDARILSGEIDYFKDDPSISALLDFPDSGQIYLKHISRNYFDIFELDLVFEKGRIRIINSGFDAEIFLVESDPIYGDYKALIKKEKIKTQLNNSLTLLLDNCLSHLDSGTPILCTLQDAANTLKVCENLLDQARSEKFV